MKVFYWILGIIGLFLVSIYTVLFTPFGNSLLKPKIEDIVSTKLNQKFELDKFKLGFSEAEIMADINSQIVINLKGNYNLFLTKFDFNYNVFADKINKEDIGLNVTGGINGKLNKFIVNGVGSLAGSKLRFASLIQDYNPRELLLDAKNLSIEKLSLIALNKSLAYGIINLNADIKDYTGVRKGKAQIYAPKISFNTKLIQKDYSIDLPSDFEILAKSDISIYKNTATATTNLDSKLFNIEALKSVYDLNSNILKSDLNINILDLSKLQTITKTKLSGSLNAKSDFKIAQNKLEFFDTTVNGLGGKIEAKFKDDKINANIVAIKLEEILNLVGKPAFVNGQINGMARITNLSKSNKTTGQANLQIRKAKIIKNELNKNFGTKLNKDLEFIADAKMRVENGKVQLNSILNSMLLKFAKFDANYDLNKNSGKLLLTANSQNLAMLFGSNKKSPFTLNADAIIKNSKLKTANLNLDGLQGKITAKFSNDKLNALVKNINSNELFVWLGQKALFLAPINAVANLDLQNPKNMNGDIKLNIKNALANSENLSEILGKKFPKNTKFDLNFNSNIKNSLADFNADFTSELANISEFKGQFNINNMTLNSNFKANVGDFSKLAFLTGTKLYGKANFIGTLIYDKDINLVLNSDIVESKTKATLKDNKLNLISQNLTIEKLLKFLGYDEFYLGNAKATAFYDLTSKKGNFKADIIEGRLAKSNFTNLISSFARKDITNEVFKDGIIKGQIANDIVNFNGNMSSQKANISVEKGYLNLLNKKLDIPVNGNIEKTDLEIKITGTSDNPKYNIKSNYLENKIKEKALDKIFGKGDENSKEKDAAKNLIKGLQNLF